MSLEQVGDRLLCIDCFVDCRDRLFGVVGMRSTSVCAGKGRVKMK